MIQHALHSRGAWLVAHLCRRFRNYDIGCGFYCPWFGVQAGFDVFKQIHNSRSNVAFTLLGPNRVNIIALRRFKQFVSSVPDANGNLTPATFRNNTIRPQKSRVLKSNWKLKCCGFPQDFLSFETTENHRLTLNFVFCRNVQSSLSFWSSDFRVHGLGFGVEVLGAGACGYVIGGSGLKVEGCGFWVEGLGFRV